MRKLSRKDRSQSDEICRVGGDRVKESLFGVGMWNATLAQTPHDMFPPQAANMGPREPCPLDGSKIPILLLTHRQEI